MNIKLESMNFNRFKVGENCHKYYKILALLMIQMIFLSLLSQVLKIYLINFDKI